MSETIETIIADLDRAIAERLDLLAALAILSRLRDAGVRSEQAGLLLTDRAESHPGHADYVHELMDVAAGWCRPGLKVWL
ncbi:MAG: hypothetical protein PGN34_25310 [Methylobacterium frigidaeris]